MGIKCNPYLPRAGTELKCDARLVMMMMNFIIVSIVL